MAVKILMLFTMSLMLFSCKEQHKASPFFEGYIEYSYQIYFYDTSRIVKEVFGKRGNKMICYVKNGNFLNEYFDTNNIGTERHLYNMDSNCFYNIVDRQPVYKSSALIDATREQNLLVSDGITKNVLGYKCPSVEVSCDVLVGKKKYTYWVQSFFCKDYLLDSSVLKKITSGGYDKIIKKYPFVSIMFVQELKGKYRETFTATRIVPNKVPDEMFTVPTNRKIKEL